jgi:trimethylamine--corrinoid protein Co-methyltransferase
VAQATGGSADDGDRLRIPREVVEWALEAAPQAVDVYDRAGSLAFRLGDDRTRFGIGVTSLYYQDPGTDEVVPFAREHMQRMVRLGDALPSYDVISTVGVLHDVDPWSADLYAALDMTANTSKPLVLLVPGGERFAGVLDLIAHLHGDLASRPFILPYFNPITPLVINESTADKMFLAIEYGLPLIYSNYGMAGATTPVTPAGTWVLLNAELLAGLVLAQLIQEGTPVVLGSLPAFFDMRGMGSLYEASSYLLNLACAEMMAWYGLPHCGTSGSGMGWGPDLLTVAHQWANHLTSCLGVVGLVPFVGDTLGSKAFSPAMTVYANEAIAQARRFAEGFCLDEAPAKLDEIAQVGPGGSYLTCESTLERHRAAIYRSKIFDNLTLEEWLARGRPRPIDRLREHTLQLLDTLQAPSDHAELTARGEAFIRKLRSSLPNSLG